jgi:hypothetical protein
VEDDIREIKDRSESERKHQQKVSSTKDRAFRDLKDDHDRLQNSVEWVKKRLDTVENQCNQESQHNQLQRHSTQPKAAASSSKQSGTFVTQTEFDKYRSGVTKTIDAIRKQRDAEAAENKKKFSHADTQHDRLARSVENLSSDLSPRVDAIENDDSFATREYVDGISRALAVVSSRIEKDSRDSKQLLGISPPLEHKGMNVLLQPPPHARRLHPVSQQRRKRLFSPSRPPLSLSLRLLQHHR